MVDVENRHARRFAVGHRIDVDDGPTTAIPAQHPAGVVLRHCQRRYRLGVARGGWRRALGDRARGVKRHVLATIGDGSFQYSVQAL